MTVAATTTTAAPAAATAPVAPAPADPAAKPPAAPGADPAAAPDPAQPAAAAADPGAAKAAAAAPAAGDPAKAPAAKPEKPAEDKVQELADRWESVVKRDAESVRREKALTAKEAEFAQSQTSHKELATLARKDPVELLGRFGVSIQDVIEFIQNDSKPSERMQVDDKVTKLEAELADMHQKFDAREKEQEQAKNKQGMAEWLGAIQETVDKAEEFPFIQKLKAYTDVQEVILLHHRDTGDLLSDVEAARMVEQHFAVEADRFASARPQASPTSPPGEPKPADETQPPAAAAPAAQAQPGTATLNNRLTGTAPKRTTGKNLPEEESIKRGAALLKWK